MKEEEKSEDNSESLDSLLDTPDTTVSNTDTNDIKKKKSSSLKKIQSITSRINIYFLLFVFIIIITGVVAFVSFKQSKKDAIPATISTTPLDPSTLSKLNGSDAKVGDPKSTLSIESNAIFSGKVLVRDSLEVAGTIRVGGALSLPGITVSGQSSFDQIQANNLAISGDTSISGQLTVQKSVTVSGNASFSGDITARRLTVDNFTLNSDIQLNRHIDAGGPTPSKTDGSGVGGGGTTSLSGTDTAGTLTVNIGGSPSAGCFATIRFSNRFNGTPHVVITPIGLAAGSLQYYINRSATEFSICSASAAPTASSFSFDYVVID